MPDLPVPLTGLAALERRLDAGPAPAAIGAGLEAGRSVQRTQTGYTTAIRVAEARDPREVWRAARLDAERLGSRAWYSIPFKRKGGGRSLVEGPTVDLAYALLGAYGNAVAGAELVREERGGSVWFLARFVDLERGVTIERTYKGHCAPAPGGFAGESRARWESMQYDAQQSKAVRGVILRGIPAWLTAGAVDAARAAVASDQLGGLDEEAARHMLADLGRSALGDGGPDRTTIPRLEAFVDAPIATWTQSQCVELVAALRAVKAGEEDGASLFPVAGEAPAVEPTGRGALGLESASPTPSPASSSPAAGPEIAPDHAPAPPATRAPASSSSSRPKKRTGDGLADLPFSGGES